MVTIVCGDTKYKDTEIVCFDKDGTLLNFSMYVPVMKRRADVLAEKYDLPEMSHNEILELMGVDPDTGSVIMGGSIHLPRIDNIKRTIEYLRKYSINASIEETSLLFDEVDDQVDFSAYIETYSGVKELLENLKKTDIKVVIFTHDSTSAAEKHLKNAGIKSYFDLILGIDPDSTYHKKPAPDMIQYACKILEVNVNAAVVIGDQETDMIAGKNAGALGCIGVLTGKSEEKDLTHADVIIQSVGDIKVK